MIKKLLTLITASFMLAAPCLNAMAGYSFHFDKPKTKSVPFDQYISSMLPDHMRASPKYLNRFFEAKKIMGIEKPTIFMRNISNKRSIIGESAQMATQNWSYLPSFILINENLCNQATSTEIDRALLHECVHINCNHWGDFNLYNAIVPKLTLPTSAFSTLYAATHKYCFGTSKKLALGASLTSALGYAYAEKQKNIFLNSEAWSTKDQRIKLCQSYEREADEKSIALLPKFIGRNETEVLFMTFNIIAKLAGDHSRPGPLYPMYSDYKSFFAKALQLEEWEVKCDENKVTKILKQIFEQKDYSTQNIENIIRDQIGNTK